MVPQSRFCIVKGSFIKDIYSGEVQEKEFYWAKKVKADEEMPYRKII